MTRTSYCPSKTIIIFEHNFYYSLDNQFSYFSYNHSDSLYHPTHKFSVADSVAKPLYPLSLLHYNNHYALSFSQKSNHYFSHISTLSPRFIHTKLNSSSHNPFKPKSFHTIILPSPILITKPLFPHHSISI